jgi:hypothetical protein
MPKSIFQKRLDEVGPVGFDGVFAFVQIISTVKNIGSITDEFYQTKQKKHTIKTQQSQSVDGV